jgi:glycosyltransferase 2 family protein
VTRKHLVLAIQIVVTAVMLTLLFRDFDWTAFWRILLTMPAWFYVVSFGAILLGQMLYAYRWRLMLTALGIGVPFKVVFEQYIVGVFFNNFLPSTMGGDWAKVYYLGRQEGYLRVGASILIDRLIGLFLLAAMAAVLLWNVPAESTALSAARNTLSVVAGALAIILAAAATLPVGPWCLAISAPWRKLERPADSACRLFEHIRRVARQPAVLMGSSAAVVAYFAVLGMIYQSFLIKAEGHAPDFLTMTAVVAAIATLSNVPIALNGLGLREQLHLALLSAFGVSREAAAGISLFLFAHILAVSAIGALLWLRGPKVGPNPAPMSAEADAAG